MHHKKTTQATRISISQCPCIAKNRLFLPVLKSSGLTCSRKCAQLLICTIFDHPTSITAHNSNHRHSSHRPQRAHKSTISFAPNKKTDIRTKTNLRHPSATRYVHCPHTHQCAQIQNRPILYDVQTDRSPSRIDGIYKHCAVQESMTRVDAKKNANFVQVKKSRAPSTHRIFSHTLTLFFSIPLLLSLFLLFCCTPALLTPVPHCPFGALPRPCPGSVSFTPLHHKTRKPTVSHLITSACIHPFCKM
jgi:hypothetical protein